MTADALARELGISPSTLRSWLRRAYPREQGDRGRPWELTDEHVDAARERWNGGAVAVSAAPVVRTLPRSARPAQRPARSPRRGAAPDPFARPPETPRDYVLGLCDDVLAETGRRAHHFHWLARWAPPGTRPQTLPVDAYYPRNRLVVLYRDGHQRHDKLRRELIAAHGLELVVLGPQLLRDGRRGPTGDREADRTRLAFHLGDRIAIRHREESATGIVRAAQSVSRAWQFQSATLAVTLMVLGVLIRAAFDGQSQAGLGAGTSLLIFGVVLDLYARVLGTLVAAGSRQPIWSAACAVFGSPAVAAHAIRCRRGPLGADPFALVSLTALIAVFALLGALVARGIGW